MQMIRFKTMWNSVCKPYERLHEGERIEQAWSVVRLGVVAWLQRHHGLRIQGFDLTSVTRGSRADLRQTVIGVVLGWML